MKKTMRQLFGTMLILSAMIVSFAACGSDDDNNEKKFRPAKVEIGDGNIIIAFEYDGQGRITKANATIGDESAPINLTYDGQGRPASIVLLEEKCAFSYNKDTIFSAKDDGRDIDVDTLIVNNNGQVLKKLTSGNNLITFEYDVNGNLSKRSESYCFTYNDKLIEYLEVWKYKYDAPNKLYSAMKLPFWIQEVLDDVEGYPILANHLLTEITNQDFEKEDGQIVDTGKIYTSIVSYQLNEHGYPTEITFLEDGEKTSAKVTYAEY